MPPLPASLRSNNVACCTEMTARIWAKTSPGASRSSPTPRPGRMPRSMSCCMGGGPTPPAMSLAGVSATAVDDAAMASKSASLRRVQWDNVTSGPSSPRRPSSATSPPAAAAVPAWAWIRRPASRAWAHRAATPSSSASTRSGEPTRERGVSGRRRARLATRRRPFAHRSRRGPSARHRDGRRHREDRTSRPRW